MNVQLLDITCYLEVLAYALIVNIVSLTILNSYLISKSPREKKI